MVRKEAKMARHLEEEEDDDLGYWVGGKECMRGWSWVLWSGKWAGEALDWIWMLDKSI